MNRLLLVCACTAVLVAAIPAGAQTNDTAAERARIANQRIQQEAERRAAIEQQQAEQEPAQAAAAPVKNDAESTDADDMSATLALLEKLGQLKDAGYLSTDEFERLKGKILEGI